MAEPFFSQTEYRCSVRGQSCPKRRGTVCSLGKPGWAFRQIKADNSAKSAKVWFFCRRPFTAPPTMLERPQSRRFIRTAGSS